MLKARITDGLPPLRSPVALDAMNRQLYADKVKAEQQRDELFEAAKQMKADLDTALGEIAQLRAQAPAPNAGDEGEWSTRWKRMEALFAHSFHPDKPGKDADVRQAIFKEFWSKLKAIRNAK